MEASKTISVDRQTALDLWNENEAVKHIERSNEITNAYDKGYYAGMKHTLIVLFGKEMFEEEKI